MLLAAFVSFLLIAAGAVIVPPAHAAGAAVTTTVASAAASGVGVQVQVGGLPEVDGAYAALIEKGAESGITRDGGYAAFASPTIAAGSSTFTLDAPVGSLDRAKAYEVVVWQKQTDPTAATIYGRGDVVISTEQWDAVFAPTTAPEQTDSEATPDTQPETTPETEQGTPAPDAPAPVAAGPRITVTAAQAAGAPGITATVAGADFGAATGVYAAFIEAGTESAVTGSGGFLAMQYVRGVAGGAFTVDLTAAADALDRAKSYEVIVWKQHTMPNPDTLLARSAVVIGDADWNALKNPAVTASVTAASMKDGLTVAVAASKLGTATGAYAALIETGTESAVTGSGGFLAMQYVRGISGGAFTVDLTSAAKDLDRAKTYEVIVWKQHTLPNADTIYARSAVAISDAQWEALTASPFAPRIEVFLADGTTPAAGTSLRAGDEIVVKGSGYDPAANVGGRGRPIPSHLPQGTYVVFGNFAADWRPSTGATSATRSVASQVWALAEGVLTQVPAEYQGAIRSQWVDIAADGTFQAKLTLNDASATPGSYGVYTYGAGGVNNADQERSIPLAYGDVEGLATSVTSATAKDGLTVKAEASGLGAVTGAYVALIEAGTEAAVTPAEGFLAMKYVPKITGGAFDVDLTAATEKLDRAKSYEVIVWKQHSLPTADTIYARSTVKISEAQWDAMLPLGATVSAPVKSATAEDGLTVKASASQLGDIPGAYVALIEAGTEGAVSAEGGFLAMQYVQKVAFGAFSIDLTTAAKNLDRTKSYEVIVWKQHSMPTADTIYARSTVTITPAQWDALFDVKTPEVPEVPETPVTPTTPPASVPGGSLRWAISSKFTDYITTIAKGSIAVSGGATRSGGQFQFGQTVGDDFDVSTGLGSVSYGGSVRFTGHQGVLDVTVSQPQIRITSASAATLYVTSGGAAVPFATLDLSSAARIVANGAVTYTAAPATLTDAGRDQVLSGYPTTLNPVTFTIGSVAAAPAGTTGTVAAAVVKPKVTLPTTPPATAGIDVDEENLAALASGLPAEVSASGFQPNEQDIKVVVYSTPVLLDTVTADANGVATWSGALPAALEDGEHTLTFQGSVDRGLVFTLNRAATVIGACTVEGATLEWGYKESFRTYIEGIAKGGWTLTDVAYQYPDYVWENGAGSFDDKTLTGLIAYGGSITFTGHDGALNTTLANAAVELAGDKGYLVFDVTGTTQGGESIDQKGVRLAEFALGDVAVVDGVLTLDAIPTTLTEAGAASFGTYAAGEELDPVTAIIPVSTDCGVAAEKAEVDSEATAVVTTATEPADSEGAPVWPWIVGGLVVVALAATGGVLIARRNRKDETAQATTEV